MYFFYMCWALYTHNDFQEFLMFTCICILKNMFLLVMTIVFPNSNVKVYLHVDFGTFI